MARKAKGTLPSGNIRYRLYIGTDSSGKKIYKSFTAATKVEAKRKAAQWKAEHTKQPKTNTNPTFTEAADQFLANRSQLLSPATMREYKSLLGVLKAEYPTFSRTHMSVMSSELVQDLINSLNTRKNPQYPDRTISPKTIKNYYGFIYTVLQTNGIELRSVKLPQMTKTELNIPENDMVKRLLADLKDTELEVPVLLAAWGPMRRGEICALQLDDIDFETNTVHVCRNIVQDPNYDWVTKAPKTISGNRYITYPSYVIELIRKQGTVFDGHPNVLSQSFDRFLKRNGYDHIRFHDLRHFSASFQIALGIPPEYVMARGGWHTPGTMQRYLHILDQQKKRNEEITNKAFEGML